MNLIDFLFLLFVAFYAFRGFHRGIVYEGLDLIAFLGGLAIALKVYPYVGAIFRFFRVGAGWSNFLGGALVFGLIVAGAIVAGRRIHKKFDLTGRSIRVGGAAFAAGWSAIFAAFLMVLTLVLPTPASAQTQIRDSLVGRTLLAPGSPIYRPLESYARNDARNLLFYLKQYVARLEPQRSQDPTECFDIRASNEIEVDPAAEIEILELVNRERAEAGLAPLGAHERIGEVARGHSADMYRRGFFCHSNPDGKDPFQRMEEGGVDFSFAGENLALAPTVEMAHRGLMNSPRHRDNILKGEFTDLGVGVYSGPLGFMVTQNFCAGCGGGE